MLDLLLGWIGLGLFVACAFGAIAGGIRPEKKTAAAASGERLRA
ncbi:MAG: hypothetical protein ACLGHO_07830 [Gammaproteobacteria bacterium]